MRAPLSTLVSWVWIAHVIEADNAFEAACSRPGRRPVRISYAMWANGLRLLDEAGVTVGDLRRRSGASCNLGGLERWGWLSVGEPPMAGEPAGGRRAGHGSHRGVRDSTPLRPTSAGRVARRVWPEILERVEESWRDRFGRDVVEQLRGAVSGIGAAMPWAPPEVHPSDGFRTHVHVGDRAAGSDTAADAGAPLAALLGSALTRLTLEHEEGAPTSLPLAANGMRPLAEGPVPLRALPERSGISKEAVAMVAGYMQRRTLATVSPERAIALTPTGAAALADYEERATRQENGRLVMALEEVLSREEFSAGLEPAAGCWRAEGRYRRQTRRLLADPIGSLPWHPMVLHRGGWPDGS